MVIAGKLHKPGGLKAFTYLVFLATFLIGGGLPAPALEQLPPPVFSHPGGFYDSPFNLLLSTGVAGATIFYTLDGSDPDPENLNGSSYEYKNNWVHRPGDPDGELLTGQYTTLEYGSPIPVTDRSPEHERLARMASTFYYPPRYFPDSTIFKGTVVRAITAMPGFESSQVVTHTYFIHPLARERFSLPVIAIATGENHLFDYEKGIYTPGVIFDNWRQNNPDNDANGGTRANYWQRGVEWEYPAHFSFWDAGSGFPDLSQDIGIRIHGGWSRSLPMKSLRIYARSSYGKSSLEFPFFPQQDYNEYKRLILRNSGNDNIYTLFRDALIQRVCEHMNFDTQAYRPVVVFLNGEYWGIHNIRERYDKHYIKRVYGIEEEDIDLLTGRNNVKEGDNLHYIETINYIEENGLQDDIHYEYIKTRIDTENFTDYQIANIFASNTDWPGNNIDYWRKRTSSFEPGAYYGHDGRWRWMAFDMDFGFGQYNTLADHNTLEFAAAAANNGWSNPLWSTFMLRKLLENESFRNGFINRFAGQLNTAFLPSRIDSLISWFAEAIRPEFPEHAERWKSPYDLYEWNFHVTHMRNFVRDRPAHQWGHLMDFFALDTATVTLAVSSAGHGYIRVNDIDILPSTPGVSGEPWPWKGTWFSGVPVTFEAVPFEGYRFSHWEGTDITGTPVFSTDPSLATMLTAHFEPAEKRDLIHLWHFNDLPGDDPLPAVAADYSAGEPGEILYPGQGAGYMDRVADGTEINLQEGTGTGSGLRVRNPSGNREIIFSVPTTGFDKLEFSFATRRTTNGAWNQSIYASADGGGSWSRVRETYVVAENWQPVRVDLSGLPELGDNPAMQIRILFGGETASGESGNNRFDNITLTGEFLYERSSYYNKPGAGLNETSSWGSEPGGSGQTPGSFDEPGVVFHILNGDEATIEGNWAVSGMLSAVVLGGGSNPVTLTIPPGYSFAGKMSIEENATLVLQNTAVPELKEVSPLSTVVFEQDGMITVPPGRWGSLHFKGGRKVFSGNYLVEGSFTAEDTGLSFDGPTSLIMKGDLSYLGNVLTYYPENMNILATGTGDQLFMAEAGKRIDAWNFYVEKPEGSFITAADIYAGNNLRLELSGSAFFSDGGRVLGLGDDLRISGDENNFDLSGTIHLASQAGTNDMEIAAVPLNNLVIDAGGDARVDFSGAAPVITINNELTIRSRSSRPVRLRDRRFHIKGNLLLDIEGPDQTEQEKSFLVFNGENLQVLENAGYGGQGLLQNMVVDGGGLRLEGSVTVDRLIGFERGIVTTTSQSILKLGPGGTISQSSTGSYVSGPMGIYNNSREAVTMEFPVGKENGLHRIVLEAGHPEDNPRLYTAEYFNQPPPQNALGTGISEILEYHGWYSIESDVKGSDTISAAIALPYEYADVLPELLRIAMVTGGRWSHIGGEFPDDMPGMVRSAFTFTGAGIFTLARKDKHPAFEGDGAAIPVFPNPVFENGTVYLPEIMDVVLVNSSGITLRTETNTGRLSMRGIPPGIYFIRNQKGQHARLVILEN